VLFRSLIEEASEGLMKFISQKVQA
jgi:hypothetical protein